MAKKAPSKKKNPNKALFSITDLPSTVAFTLDKQYRYVTFSPLHAKTMKKIWGVNIETGASMLAYISRKADQAKAKRNFDLALKGKHFTKIEEYGDPGHLRTVYQDHYGPVLNKSGKVVGLYVWVLDLTQFKSAENKASHTNAILSSSLDSIDQGILIVDTQARVIFKNQKFLDIWQFPSALVNEKDDFKLMQHALDQLAEPQLFKQQVDYLYEQLTEESQDLLKLVDGRVLSRFTKPHYLGKVIIGRVWSFRDVTNELKQQNLLAEFKNRHELIVSSFGRVVYDYDVQTGTIRWSGKCEEVLGFSVEELGDISTWENNIHQDDRTTALQLLERAQEQVSSYKTIYRFKTKPGRYIWLQDVGFFIPNKEGIAVRMVGEMTDISQQVESDREIRHLASFPMHNPEVVFELTRDGMLSYANPAYFETLRRLGVKDHKAFLNSEADTTKMAGVAWKATTEVTISNRTFSEKIFYLPEKDLLRIYAFDLTDRLEAERQRTDLELTYKALFESDTDSIMLLDIDDDPGKIISANPATATMYGYTMAELLSMHIQDIDVVTSGAQLTYQGRVEHLLKNNQQTFEVIHRKKDGTIFPLEVVGAVIEISGKRVNMAIMRDIAERKKAEEALRESEQRFRVLHEASFGGIAIHDMGHIVECNSGLSRLTGYSHDELIGFNGLNLIHPDDRNLVLENIKAQVEHPYDARGIRKDGSVYAIEIKGKAVPYRGKVMRVTEFRDITERVQAAESIKEQNARLQAIAENLRFKNQQLDEFTQIVSHNLRSPAGNIVSLSDFLAQEQNPEEQAKILELLKQSGANILTTLSELNEVLKIKQSKNIEKQLLRFTDVYQKAYQMLNAQITATQATLSADFSEVDEIEYPHIYLESIFLNLMSNALKYFDSQRPLHLSLRTLLLDGRICLEVADTGLGINLARYGHQIFKMRKTFHHHPDSRGIGLFMIKNQIEAMGGTISVTSEEGVGSVFRVIF